MTQHDRFAGIEGRVAAVTGAGQGIGRAIADSLIDNGARVAYLDVRTPSDAETLERSDSTFVVCDVSDPGSVDESFAAVEQRLGSPSILVNNAGIFEIMPLEETSLGDWEKTMSINLTGMFLCCQRALPAMRAAGYGRIVSIGSSAGKTGGAKNVAAYAASKAAVHSLAKSIASEYARFGVTSNALAPALINTDMVAGISDLADAIPVGRLGEPADVARAVLFLVSERASFITAEVMDVNGGFLID